MTHHRPTRMKFKSQVWPINFSHLMTINTKFQKNQSKHRSIIYWRNLWKCSKLCYTPMVPTHSPGKGTTVTIGEIRRKPKDISLCTPKWHPRLQCTAICTHKNGGFNPWETDMNQKIHRALQKGICTKYILWTLPPLEPIGKWDMWNKSFRNSLL